MQEGGMREEESANERACQEGGSQEECNKVPPGALFPLALLLHDAERTFFLLSGTHSCGIFNSTGFGRRDTIPCSFANRNFRH